MTHKYKDAASPFVESILADLRLAEKDAVVEASQFSGGISRQAAHTTDKFMNQLNDAMISKHTRSKK